MEGACNFDVSNEDFSVVDTELESLLAIFIDELSYTKKSDGTIEEIQIQLHPFTGHDTTKQFVCMTLIIRPSPKYPDEIPFFEIRNPRGLGEEEIASLLQDMKLKAQEYVGEPVLYTLIEMARESLTEGNVPHCPCVLCLEHFDSKQAFHRTSCYHYFHLHCLSAYLCHTRNMIEEEKIRQEKEGSSHRDDKSDQTDIVCPVCRKSLDEESLAVTCEVKTESEDSKFELSPEMRQQQKWMSEVYARQKAKGGIIDLEAEKNKFLINQDTVLITTPTKNEMSKQKDATTPCLNQAKDVKNLDQVERKGPKGRGRGQTSDRHFDKRGSNHGRGRGKDKKSRHENLNSNKKKFEDCHSQSKNTFHQDGQDLKIDNNFPNYEEMTRTAQRPELRHSESLEFKPKIHCDKRKEKQNMSRGSDYWSYENKEDKYSIRDTQQEESRHRGYKGRSVGVQRIRSSNNPGHDSHDSGFKQDQQFAKDLQNHQINQKWRQKNYGKQKPFNDKPIRFEVYDDDEDEKAKNSRINYNNTAASLHMDDGAINDFKLAIDNSEYNCWEEEIDEYAFQDRHVRLKDWDQYKDSRKNYEKKLNENLKERVEKERTLIAEERRMRNEAEQKRAKADERAKTDNPKPVKSILDQFKEQNKQKQLTQISNNDSPQQVADEHIGKEKSLHTGNKQIEVGAGANDGDIQWIKDYKANAVLSGDVEKKIEPNYKEKNFPQDSVEFQKKVYQGRPNRQRKDGRHRQNRDDFSETVYSHEQSSDDRPKKCDYNSRNQTRRHRLSDRKDFFDEPVESKFENQKECNYLLESCNYSDKTSDRYSDSRNRTFENPDDRIRFHGDMRNDKKLINENKAKGFSNHHKKPDMSLQKDNASKKSYSKQILQETNDFVDNSDISSTSSNTASASSVKETPSINKPVSQGKDTKFKKTKPLDFTKRRGQAASKKTATVPPPGL